MKNKYLSIGIALIGGITSCSKPTENVETKIVTTDSSKVVEQTTFNFESGNCKMVIDAQNGARIVSMTVDGQESLIQKNEFETFGSTFWTAPQSTWGWPPVTQIDSEPYTKIAENEFESKLADTIGVKVSKKFITNTDSSISIIYTIKNQTDSTIKIAPWEISRVATGGTTIFPSENTIFKGKKPFGEVKITTKNGISLYKYDSASVTDNKKSFAFASKGWLAQHKGELLLIKQFENISAKDCAPDESEIEIYANPNKIYIEIEQQGAYKDIKSKSSYSWEVKWYLRTIENKKYSELEYQKLIEGIIK